MSYRSNLEARLARKATRAIKTFDLVEEGDRVMVGLSGGKDSWALMNLLDVLRRRAPVDFSLVAVNVDSGYAAYKHEVIARTCAARGWEYRIEHTSIGDIMDDVLDADATPCSLCARLRRGVLYRIAAEVGATKIALGHHADDFVETLLLNLLFAGSLKAMPARLVSDDRRHVVIRPLVYVTEDEARAYTRECQAGGHRLLLSGLRRPQSEAAAHQALAAGPRARASWREELDAEGARQRRSTASAGHASEPPRRVARRERTSGRHVCAGSGGCCDVVTSGRPRAARRASPCGR